MENKIFRYGNKGNKPKKYPREIKKQAIFMYLDTCLEFMKNGECVNHTLQSVRYWLLRNTYQMGKTKRS